MPLSSKTETISMQLMRTRKVGRLERKWREHCCARDDVPWWTIVGEFVKQRAVYDQMVSLWKQTIL